MFRCLHRRRRRIRVTYVLERVRHGAGPRTAVDALVPTACLETAHVGTWRR